jgi:antitoxin component YwqK of YwqJK toxin-antitoxin module
VQYYANGQKRVEQRFEMGLPEGTQTQWYQDGTKYVEKTFVKGKQNGTETIWNPKGQIVKQREFRDGAPLLSASGDAKKSSEPAKSKPATDE